MSGSYKPEDFTVNAAAEAIDMYARVRLDSSQDVVEADAGELAIGWVDQDYEADDLVTVKRFGKGTCLVIAAAAFSAGADLFQDDNGQVNDVGDGPVVATALEAATASGDLVEAIAYDLGAPEREEDMEVVLESDFLDPNFSRTSPPLGFSAINTSSTGDVTIGPSTDAHGGVLEAKFTSNDQAEAAGIDQGDELMFDIDQLTVFKARFRAPTLNSNDEIVIGMISDQNDDPSSIAEGVWLSVDGAQDIHVESDDGTNRNDDEDTGFDLGNDVWADVYVDFTDLTDVKVYVDVDDSGLALQSSGTTLDVSNYSDNLQPIAMITKSGGTHQTNLDVDYLEVRASRA